MLVYGKFIYPKAEYAGHTTNIQEQTKQRNVGMGEEETKRKKSI